MGQVAHASIMKLTASNIEETLSQGLYGFGGSLISMHLALY